MKKVLIYIEERHLKNAGGPLGYNYNLKYGLDSIGAKNVYFLNNGSSKIESRAQNIKNSSGSLKRKLLYNRFVRSVYGGFKHMIEYIKVILKRGDKKTRFDDFDVVHFHSALDLYKCQKQLKNYRGVVLLTTHSPIMPSYELKRDYEKWTRILFFYVYWFGKHIDLCAMRRADYIVTPCENAMDSYSRYSRKYSVLTKNKFINLLTGCIDQKGLDINEESIKKKYGISDHYFNIAYLGRHNKVKGYDILKQYAAKMNGTIEDVCFIIGGTIGPCHPPKLDNWKELGFTKDAVGIMKCCDVYVSCNRDTYFDLATIQALSVGTIVITTRVGGNLFFEKGNIPGVFLFSTYDEFLEIVSKIKAMSQLERDSLKLKIIDTFNKLFDSLSFAKKYVDMVESL